MRILGLCTIEDVMEEIIGEEVRPAQYSEITVRSREIAISAEYGSMNYARWSTRPISRRLQSRADPPPHPPRTRAVRAPQQQRRRASSSARRRSTRGIRCCSRRVRAGASTDSVSQDGLTP